MTVNSERDTAERIDCRGTTPSIAQVADALLFGAGARATQETMAIMEATAKRWAAEIKRAGQGGNNPFAPFAQIHVMPVSLRDVADTGARVKILQVPTAFSITSSDVRRLQAAGRVVLRDSLQFQALVTTLDVLPPEGSCQPAEVEFASPRALSECHPGYGTRSMQNTGMLIHPTINPVALQLGPLAIHWYGLTYLAAFGLFFFLATRRLKHQPYASITGPGAWARRDIEDILFLGVMGVVIGGRLGYCLFYKPGYYLANPLEILAVWQGGMSFHGGLIGVLVSQWWFARTRQRPWLQVMDFIAPCVPLGLASGRVGNFLNGELWGRFSSPDMPWGMVFKNSGSMLPRHPSQVYQFLLEGVLLFILLWLYARKPCRMGQVSGAFLVGYGIFRFIAEFFREPDDYLGLLTLGMSMGQWLCVPMVLAGIWLWLWASKQPFQGQNKPSAQ